MAEVTKRAERLARALAVVNSTLEFDIAFDRAHWTWPEFLVQAQAIINAQNLLEYCEGSRPLHGDWEGAKFDRDTYDAHYTGPDSHQRATDIVLGLEEDNDG